MVLHGLSGLRVIKRVLECGLERQKGRCQSDVTWKDPAGPFIADSECGRSHKPRKEAASRVGKKQENRFSPTPSRKE